MPPRVSSHLTRAIRGRLGAASVAVLAAFAVVFGAVVTPTTPAPASAAAALPGWLHTSGAELKTASDGTYVVKAAAWFGMETSNCAPHGLWTISLDAGLAQIASMGFNTIRLPFSNECLAQAHPNSVNEQVNPGLASLSVLQLLDRVVERAAAHGLNVILDRHRPDSGAQSELWYTARYSEAQWIADWRMLAARYADQPTVIGFDLHNEPHGSACWGCGDPATDWQAAATRAGDAVLAVNPRVLIVVEGVERQPDGSSTWWGGGLAGVAAKPVELAVPDQVVYSPHDYPSTVFAQTWFQASDYPADLPALWEQNWGYIATEGIAPVLLGEFGTKLETASDQQWLAALVGYLGQKELSFAYWSFNPNSGDTGGLVQDDWMTPQAAKLAALQPLLGVGVGAGVVPAPVPVPSTASAPTPSPSAPAPLIPGTAAPALPGPAPAPTVPVPTVPVPTVPVPTAPAPPGMPTPGEDAVAATWSLQSAWSEGYVADLVVTAGAATSGWTVTWPDTASTAVVNSWGMTCTVAPKTSITCTGVDWAAALDPGESVKVGLQVASPSAPAAPKLTVTAH